MKTLRFVMVQLFVCHISIMCMAQQNLVANANFEDTITCPSNSNQLNASCKDWRVYNNTTPDYFNACSSGNAGVPNNYGGNQPAASGNAYCGVLAHHDLVTHFEYIATQMTPLVPGNKYEISMSVNLSDNSSYATNNLGVFLYDSGPSTIGTSTILPTPQVYYDNYGVITEKQNWVRLKKTFFADSAYDNIVIGVFNNTSNTYATTKLNNTGFAAFYYIDSVVVKLTDYFWVTNYDSSLCAGDTVTVDYLLDPVLNTNNVFTLQLSDKNGSFANPLAIGTKNDSTSGSITGVIPNTTSNGTGYRMRIISSSIADTSDTTAIAIKIGNIDSSNVVVTASSSSLCAGAQLNFSASTNVTPTTYQWTGPNSFSSGIAAPSITSVTTAMSGNYYATVNFYGCEVKDTFSVTVNPTPFMPIIGSNSPVCTGDTLKLTANSSSGTTYTWTGPNNFNSTLQNPNRYSIVWSDTGTYTVIATLGNCVSPANTTNVTANPPPFAVIYPNNDSICVGAAATFTALLNNTGGTPTFQWYVNRLPVNGSGTTFTTNTLQNNDVVSLDMTEYTQCGEPYIDPSNDVRMTVLPYLTPSVSIVSDITTPVPLYHYITFTATATDAGDKPMYQWKRNGTDVLGAQAGTWSANTLDDNDSISVVLTSSYLCPQPDTAVSNGITVNILSSIGDIEGLENLALYPNPNSGQFVLSANNVNTEQVKIEVMNAMGQVVFTGVATPVNGVLNERVQLDGVTSGTYSLKLSAEGQQKVVRFSIK